MNTNNENIEKNRCPGCGTTVFCGIAAGQTSCWCMQEPMGFPVPEASSSSGCYCLSCLSKKAQLINS